MLQHQQSSSTLTATSSTTTSVDADREYSAVSLHCNGLHPLPSASYHNHKSNDQYGNHQKFDHYQFKNYQNGISLSSSSSSNSSNSNFIIEHQQKKGWLSSEIFEEIQRFESVHPCIYALYNLIERLPDLRLQESFREQVIRIEDAFVNSEEWTLSRAVQELKMGVVGSLNSAKTSFIHFFLTEQPTSEESPEGGRFKKEIVIDSRSYLLLIRDEGCNTPEFQFTHWIDCVIILFAVGNRESYLIALQYFKKMTAYRNLNDIPVFLVGTLDSISDTLTREVTTEEARMASLTMKMSCYFECYTYKPNVHEIFYTVCKKFLQQQRRHQRLTLPLGLGANSIGNFNQNYYGNNSSGRESHQLCKRSSASGESSGSSRSKNYHQRSVSAIPVHENLQASKFNAAISTSARNNSAVLRKTNQISQQQHYYQQPHNLSQQSRSVVTSSLVNVPAACSSSASTFYQNFANTDLQRADCGVTQSQHLPQFRRENNFVRDSGRFFSSFMPSSGLQHHNATTFTERISTPDFSSSDVAPGMSPAYSHNSLASQFSHLNTSGPQYSKSSSNVVANSNNQYNNYMYNSNYQDSALIPGTSGGLSVGSSGFMSSTALLNNAAALNATNSSANVLLPTPSNTPNTQRKNRRISNIFRGNKDGNSNHSQCEENQSSKHNLQQNQNLTESIVMGIGREIPIKEGILYKKSHRGLNREWKKKYVCLYADGRIRYHPTHKDYRNNSDAKEIKSLLTSTVRLSGRQRLRTNNRNSLLPQQQQNSASSQKDILPEDISLENGETSTPGEGNSDGGELGTNNNILITSTSSMIGQLRHQDLPQRAAEKSLNKLPATNISAAAEVKKKRSHKLLGSGAKKDDDDEDLEFEIISSNQKRWEFSATTTEERDEWVCLIEEIIERCIQSQKSQKEQKNSRAHGDRADVQALRLVPGNNLCADCAQQRPDWASLNLGTLICIECSGIHRNLGSHISRVRSLDLDDWPTEYLLVMQAIGNKLANSIWELNAPLADKPNPDSSREDKETWIKTKYEQKLYLPILILDKSPSHLLIEAVLAHDLRSLLTVLPYTTEKDVNRSISSVIKNGAKLGTRNNVSNNDQRTSLHLVCSIGAAEILQLLIWHNVNIYAVDESQRTALWYARLNGSHECEAILINAGLNNEYAINNPTKVEKIEVTDNAQPDRPHSSYDGSIKDTESLVFNSSSIGRGNKAIGHLSAAAADIAKRRQSDYIVKKNFNENTSMNSNPNGIYIEASNLSGHMNVSKRTGTNNSAQTLPTSVI